MTDSITLELGHASLLTDVSDSRLTDDILYMLDTGAHIISFTELYGDNRIRLNRACLDRGYQHVTFPQTGEGFALNAKAGVRLKDKDAVQAHPGGDGLPARYINAVKVGYKDETIWYHTGHWLAHLNDSNLRVKRHNQMTQQMVAQVRKHGQGNDLAFFSGDVNEDDRKDENAALGNMNTVFMNNGLVTIWDEKRVYPNTFGDRTIDVIGSYDRDGRVEGKRYKIHPKQNSDHRFVSVWYEIAKKSSGGGNGGGNPSTPTEGDHSGNPAHDNPYNYGKLVSWKDYRDKSIYDLPQAVDDSDGPSHGDYVDD